MGIRKVHYYPNPGNAGDALIAAATFQHFNKHGIECIVGEKNDRSETVDALCFGGGGNLVSNYGDAAGWLETATKSNLPAFLLPHTINGHQELLNSLGKNIHLFCRERVSFDYAKLNSPAANIYLAHDMALSLDTAEILSEFPSAAKKLLGTKRRFEVLRKITKCLIIRALGNLSPPYRISKNQLNVFRTDGESTNSKGECDISQLFAVTKLDRELSILSAGLLLLAVNPFRVISTDRLHVCIGSALLGKEVRFYSNDYYKNEAVYRSSLESRFSNVQWMGARTDVG